MYGNSFGYGIPLQNIGIKKGLFSLSKINWSNILSNTQKTLGIINQTIPIVYQIKPIVQNAKTMFKIATSLKDSPKNNSSNTKPENNKTISSYSNIEKQDYNKSNKPIFFI